LIERPRQAIVQYLSMRIVGVGLDAVEIDRIRRLIDRHGERFLQRVFTAEEITYCRRRRRAAESFAARFAAKEAAMKALGTGHSQGVTWLSVEVVRRHGPPRVAFHGAARTRLAALHGTSAFLTISHSEALAFAHVILVGS
jgi:holo-[acyl-carrier protein] synthase